MSGCSAVQAGFTEYLDGRMNGRAMQQMAAHIEKCRACAREWTGLRQTQASLAVLGPVPEPPDLLLRIRVAVSQERARRHRSIFDGWSLAWKNTVGPFLLHAGAGFASAVLLLGSIIVLVTMFAQPQVAQASKDEPLGTRPRLVWSAYRAAPATVRSVTLPHRSWSRSTSTARAPCTTTASSPGPTTRPPARRWKTCWSTATSSRPASSASRFAASPCSPSPASRCAGKSRKQGRGNRE